VDDAASTRETAAGPPPLGWHEKTNYWRERAKRRSSLLLRRTVKFRRSNSPVSQFDLDWEYYLLAAFSLAIAVVGLFVLFTL
jgi:hypothetical protein